MLASLKHRLTMGLARRIANQTLRHEILERTGRQEFFRAAFKAISFNGIEGDYAEFGCCGGFTFSLAYRECRHRGLEARLWAFDSFSGLPESGDVRDEHPRWVAGAMATSEEEFHEICTREEIPKSAYKVIPGFYEESLPRLQEGEPNRLALVYIDCDLYSSTREVLRFLAPRLRPGMILAFDDYHCWSSTAASGERLAFEEFVADHPEWDFSAYRSIGWHGESFVVFPAK